uniref:RNA-directed RNA polymerase n=1 Tax=Perinereis aibuhitensis picobirna-like virus 1 TaxID=3237979 RepID=A0AB39A391_9VIRU
METRSVANLAGLPGFDRAMASQRRFAQLDDAGYRTPLFPDQAPDTVLNEWLAVIEEETGGAGSIFELEQSEVKKFGPYYNRPYREWKGNVEKYFVHDISSMEQALPEELERAMNSEIELIKSYLPNGKVRALSVQEAYERSNKNTNLGLPYAMNHQTAAQKVVDEYVRRANKIVRGDDPHIYPFILFKRVQPGGPEREDGKNRPVWGADHAETYASLSLLYPLLDALSNTREFAHLRGIDELEKVLKLDLPKWSHAISLDLSAADANFSPILMSCGFQMISALVDGVDPRMIYTLYKYYVSGELLTPEGLAYGAHGMPSGVGLTNLIESLVFRVLARIYLEDFPTYRYYQNGDDGLYLVNSIPEPEELAGVFAKYGCVVNVDKTSTDPHHISYLQRHMYPEYGYSAIMSTVRMLNRVLYAERGVDAKAMGMSPKDFWTLNTIAKLENCKRNPLFEKFVRFVRRGDKFGLDPKPVLNKSVNAIEGYSVFRIDEGETGSQRSSSGLLNFATVKVLLQ